MMVKSPNFSINNISIGEGYPCFIIGEVAQAHDGSLGTAHAYIDAIANAGANAVKFQTHIADAESSIHEPWRVKFSCQDRTRYDYWKRMEFTEEHWHGLRKHAEEKGLVFLSSPFSPEAVDLLNRVGVPAWKIASGEISNPLILEKIFETKYPLLVSTGMSLLEETDTLVDSIRKNQIPFSILQCTSCYPCPPEKIGINLLPFYSDRYQCPVGLSDHSGSIFSSFAAVSIGCQILELHVTLSREMFGPDVTSSVTTGELKTLVEGIRYIERIQSHPVDKDLLSAELKPLKEIFSRSLFANKHLRKGDIIRKDDLAAKKPGIGIPAMQIKNLVGKRLMHDVPSGRMLKKDDIEDF